ncbi:MAG: ABC transporter ATP-binding protein [Acidobacteria bacterium]|nr:ABC transporter ATP-binding protein [Acidobacteriota bacterium]
MNANDDNVIEAIGLRKTYRSGADELVIFDGLDFAVRRGERLAIIGESGVGKSTLMYLLGALDRPSGGTIKFNHRDISGLSDAELADLRNREIGFVWQNHSLLPEFTAVENVMMPLLIRGATHDDALAVSMAGLDEVGLRQRASHRAGELSGGEQQRVALARALAGKPKLLLADEPTGSLDYRTGGMIMTLLEDLHRTHDLTSIYVTHNLAFAGRSDRILRLDKGKLEMSGDLFHAETSNQQDTPYQTAAMGSDSREPATSPDDPGAGRSLGETRTKRSRTAQWMAGLMHREGKHYV